jgi:16S rRNA (uracil1498-N3)-methyltransferase
MHRFFISSGVLSGDTIHFSKVQSHQIVHVLKMSTGEIVSVFNAQAEEYEVQINSLSPGTVTAMILKKYPPQETHGITISLFISPIKHDHFEYILQKTTEIGVSSITPVTSTRTIVSVSSWAHKVERWKRIIIEAAEQSQSTRLPELQNPINFSNALLITSTLDRGYIAWENEKDQTLLAHVLDDQNPKPKKVGLFIGPEGGFTDDEIKKAVELNLIPVSLGSQILRSETAAIVGSFLLINSLTYIWSTKN